MYGLASLLRDTKRYNEAEPLYREMLALHRAALPEGHPRIAVSVSNLADLLRDTKRYDEAEFLYREALAQRRTALPDGHPDIAWSMNELGLLLKACGRHDEAEPLLLYRQASTVPVVQTILQPRPPASITFNIDNVIKLLARKPVGS